jgi:hypothetical protein
MPRDTAGPPHLPPCWGRGAVGEACSRAGRFPHPLTNTPAPIRAHRSCHKLRSALNPPVEKRCGAHGVGAGTIHKLEPRLGRYLRRFRDCFQRSSTWRHLPDHIGGQLSDLPRKSVEAVALAAGKPVRTLQEFLTDSVWEVDGARRVAEIVANARAQPKSIAVMDETSWEGDKTLGVQRLYCGSVRKRRGAAKRGPGWASRRPGPPPPSAMRESYTEPARHAPPRRKAY